MLHGVANLIAHPIYMQKPDRFEAAQIAQQASRRPVKQSSQLAGMEGLTGVQEEMRQELRPAGRTQQGLEGQGNWESRLPGHAFRSHFEYNCTQFANDV